VPLELFSGAGEPVAIPLGNGVLEIGEDLFVVLDPTHVLLSARVAPDQDFVRLYEETPSEQRGRVGDSFAEEWVIYIVSGEAAALDLARRFVQEPEGPVEGRAAPSEGEEVSENGDCGCSQEPRSGDRTAAGLCFAFLLLYFWGVPPKKKTASKWRPT